MKKRMTVMLIIMAVLFGGILIWKVFTRLMMMHYLGHQSKAVSVSVMTVKPLPWQPILKATGTLRAINGVEVTTSLGGMVDKIYFEPGSMVTAGTLLLQLSANTELGQLQSLQAQEKLAQITYDRDKAQFAIHAISKQTLDADFQNLQNLQGQVAEQQATVNKKSIRAPFSGRLGIRKVNLGQYINPGDQIVSLQTLNPIYIDFYLPQQAIAQLKVGQVVNVVSDAFPNKKYHGNITTINPAVDVSSRNVLVEATINNAQYELIPGMFAQAAIDIGQPTHYLTLPQAAISFNPYGSVVYLVQEKKKDKDDDDEKPTLTVMQTFVTTGETRGDQIAILKGIKENDRVVTSGQLKLKNGSEITINNAILPTNDPSPRVSNDH